MQVYKTFTQRSHLAKHMRLHTVAYLLHWRCPRRLKNSVMPSTRHLLSTCEGFVALDVCGKHVAESRFPARSSLLCTSFPVVFNDVSCYASLPCDRALPSLHFPGPKLLYLCTRHYYPDINLVARRQVSHRASLYKIVLYRIHRTTQSCLSGCS